MDCKTVAARTLLGLASAMAWMAPAHAACLSKIDMPVSIVDGRAVARVGIKGKQVPLAVDSGAFFSMITDAAAQQLELKVVPLPYRMRINGLAGSIRAHMTTVDKLQFVAGSLPDVDFVVGGNEPGAGTMGLLGRNLLTFSDVEFDLANGMIRLMFPKDECAQANMAYWAGDKPVIELDLVRTDLREGETPTPAIAAPVKVNGKSLEAVFDTGAWSMLTLHAAHAAGIADADMTADGRMYGAGEGRRDAWTAPVRSFQIGAETINNSHLGVADHDGPDMLLGIDFFLSHRIYVSRKQHRLYMTYNGGPVFAMNTLTQGDRSAAEAGSAPTDAESFMRRAAMRRSRRDTAGALADLDRACALAPTSADCFARRGMLHVALEQPDAARQDFDTALRLDPDRADARLQRASLHEQADRRDDALADLQVLDRAIPAQSDLRRAMGDLYDELDLPAQALAQWSQWLAAHPHEATRDEVQNARCWARLRLGADLDKALDDCDDAVDRDGDNAHYLASRAWAHLRLGNTFRARRDFDRVIALQADTPWSHYGRGLLRLRTGDVDGGRADLDAARKLDQDIEDKVRRSGVAGDLVPAAQAAR